MATFVLKKKVRKKGIVETPLDRETLRVGSALDNDIVIDDPLVSPYHCQFEWIGGQCRLSDTQSVSGTFVDGAVITEYFVLKDGQTISLGLNEIKIDIDLGEEACGVFVEENVGTGEKQLHREIHITRRPWYQQSKYYALGGAIALLVPILALAALGKHSIFQNGELTAAHAENVVTKGGASDCAGCHSSFRGVKSESCGACHQETVGKGATHEFFAGNAEIDSLRCTQCHKEHMGADFAIAPRKSYEASSCLPCHANAHKEELGGAVATEEGGGGDDTGTPAPAGMRKELVGFDAFSHLDHAERGIEKCDRCHKPNVAG
ncbi:MAG: FHA domain-containing protein, partial [Planctomycetota bacterium]